MITWALMSKAIYRNLFLCCAALVSACSGGSKDKLVVVGMDGLDPVEFNQLIALGYLPTFERVISEGVYTDLHVDRFPMFSPVLWTTLATGYLEAGHGVGDWLKDDGSIYQANDLGAERFWEVADQNGRPTFQAGYLMTTPPSMENGVSVSQTFAVTGSSRAADPSTLVYPPEYFADFTAMIPTPAWVKDVPLIGASLDSAGLSNFLGADEALLRIFERTWDVFRPEVSVLYFSGADKLGHMMDARSEAGREFVLERGHGWTDAKRALVVRQYYVYLDSVLARILAIIDPNKTTVVICSDHGWQLEGTAKWDTRHRDPGLLIGWGKRARAGASPESPPRQIDLGKTLYGLANQAAAKDMPGRDLNELFRLPKIRPLQSRLITNELRNTDGEDSVDEALQREQLQQLGYIDDKDQNIPDQQN